MVQTFPKRVYNVRSASDNSEGEDQDVRMAHDRNLLQEL